jgi:HEAT repeat protein
LKDVVSRDGFKWRQAAAKLKNAKVEKRRDDVTKALLEVVKDDKMDGFHRAACIELLGLWGTAECVPTLLPLLDSTNFVVRRPAFAALGALKDERAAEPLAKKLTVLGDRMQASAALKALGSKAEKAVAEQLKHADWTVQLEAARVLKEIGTKASKEALEKAAEKDNMGRGLVARAAQEALAEIAKR